MFNLDNQSHHRQCCTTVLLALSVLLLISCATRVPSVRGEKFLLTSIEAGDKVGVVIFDYLLCYERKGENCIPNEKVSDAQQFFGTCIAKNISATAENADVIYDDGLQNALFTHREEQDYSDQALDNFISSPDVTKILKGRNLKYLVLLDISTREKDRRTTFAADEFLWGVGRESTRETVINSRIYDVPNAQLTGHLNTRLSGSRGFVVPVMLIIPLPPVPYSTMTETNTCRAMGRAIGRYLVNNEGIEGNQ